MKPRYRLLLFSNQTRQGLSCSLVAHQRLEAAVTLSRLDEVHTEYAHPALTAPSRWRSAEQ